MKVVAKSNSLLLSIILRHSYRLANSPKGSYSYIYKICDILEGNKYIVPFSIHKESTNKDRLETKCRR